MKYINHQHLLLKCMTSPNPLDHNSTSSTPKSQHVVQAPACHPPSPGICCLHRSCCQHQRPWSNQELWILPSKRVRWWLRQSHHRLRPSLQRLHLLGSDILQAIDRGYSEPIACQRPSGKSLQALFLPKTPLCRYLMNVLTRKIDLPKWRNKRPCHRGYSERQPVRGARFVDVQRRRREHAVIQSSQPHECRWECGDCGIWGIAQVE